MQQVLHQAPLRGAEPGPAALQGEKNHPLLDLLLHDLGLIWLVVEKYANSVYKSICDALTVKIGKFAMAPTVLQKRPHFAKVQNHHSSKNLLAKSSSLSSVFVANNCATKYIWRNLT